MLLPINRTLFGWNGAHIIRNIFPLLIFFWSSAKHSLQNSFDLKSAWKILSEHVVSELFKWHVSGVRSGHSYCHLDGVSRPDSKVRLCSHGHHLVECAKKCNSSRKVHWWRDRRAPKEGSDCCLWAHRGRIHFPLFVRLKKDHKHCMILNLKNCNGTVVNQHALALVVPNCFSVHLIFGMLLSAR